VNLTLLSYRGACGVGLTMDSAAVTDPGVFVDCLRAGFDEVLALGGAHEPARSPLDGPAVEAGGPAVAGSAWNG
jgi:hypothetical protein